MASIAYYNSSLILANFPINIVILTAPKFQTFRLLARWKCCIILLCNCDINTSNLPNMQLCLNPEQ